VTEFIELIAQCVVVRCFEIVKGAFEQRSLELDHLAEIDSHRESRSVAEIIRGEQSTINEPPGTDQQSFTGERREALIGRVAVSRGAEGQNLPEALPARGKKVYEGKCFITKIADAEAPGQRRRVQKYSAGSLKVHGMFCTVDTTSKRSDSTHDKLQVLGHWFAPVGRFYDVWQIPPLGRDWAESLLPWVGLSAPEACAPTLTPDVWCAFLLDQRAHF